MVSNRNNPVKSYDDDSLTPNQLEDEPFDQDDQQMKFPHKDGIYSDEPV